MTPAAAPRLIVMGVSGVGKSTIGSLLARELDVAFLDADDFHSEAAVAKMRRGEPLDDADRAPWLARCGRALAAEPAGGVLACSALARRYRDALLREVPDGFFIHLSAVAADVARRTRERSGHFMPPSLLASQLATLEELDEKEPGVTVEAGEGEEPAAIVGAVREMLRRS